MTSVIKNTVRIGEFIDIVGKEKHILSLSLTFNTQVNKRY